MLSRMRALRIECGLSQKGVAKILHISSETYAQYEDGTSRVPLGILVRLASFYQSSMDYLAELTDERAPYPPKKKRRTWLP